MTCIIMDVLCSSTEKQMHLQIFEISYGLYGHVDVGGAILHS